MPIKIKCDRIIEGLTPFEKVVYIRTVEGIEEELSVYSDLISGKFLTASAVESDDDRVLIEFPNESASGKWRAWVRKDIITQ